ncbi:MAG: AsmA family protein [Rubrivivax sp.]|nr:MAG: AsmA family protein [Rubrivivax sp.]
MQTPDASRPRRHTAAKWTLGILAVLVAAVAVCEFQGWPFLKGPLERNLSERLQRKIALGDQFRMHLLGGIRVNTNAVAIGSPGNAPDLLQGDNAFLDLPYSTVLGLMRSSHEPVHITALEFDRVDASLTRDAQGNANWQMTPKGEPKQDAGKSELPRFDKLLVKAGRVRMQDDILKLNLDAKVSTAEGDQAKGAAGLLIDGGGQYLKRPFELHIKSSGLLPLAAAPEKAITVPISVQATAGKAKLRFDGQGVDVLTLARLDGTLTLSGPSLAAVGDAVGVTLPTTSLFTLKGQLGKAGEVWSLHKTDLHVGNSQLGGDFKFDRGLKVPLLTGELRGSRFVLSDLAPAFGAPAPGAENPPPPNGKVVPQRTFDIPSLHAMEASLDVRLKRVELGSLFAQPLEPLNGELSLRGGVLSISKLLASTASGQVSGDITLDGNPKPATWKADVHWKNIKLEEWLSPRNQFARQEQQPAPDTSPRYVTGQLGGHAKLHGQGNSAAQMLGTMGGDAQAWVQDGTVSHLMVEAIGLDVAQALGVMVSGDKLLPMRCAVVRLKAQQGQLQPEVGIVDTEDSTVLVSGSLSLMDESLNLTLTARPKDVSPLTLRSPLRVQGTFANPQVRLESKPLGLKVLSAVALGFVNPLASIIPLIDLGEKGDGGCQQALSRLKGDQPRPLSAASPPKR